MNFTKYNCIDNEEKLEALNNFLMLSDNFTPRHKYLAIDTEANGLSIRHNTVVGVSLAVSKDRGFYIPFLEWIPDATKVSKRTRKGIEYLQVYKEGHLKCVWTGAEFPEFVEPDEYDFSKRYPAIPEMLRRWTQNSKLWLWNQAFDVNMLRRSLKLDILPSVDLDGSLLVHVLDENHYTALKKNVGRYRGVFGIDPYAVAATEKRELEQSIIGNGGNKAGEVWRAGLEVQSKYACSDAFYTFGICQEAKSEFKEEYGAEGVSWFEQKEVMPLAKEVVVNMKEKGVYIDVPYFEKLHQQIKDEMYKVEDKIIGTLKGKKLFYGFPLGKEEVISGIKFKKKLMELEGLPAPQKTNAAGKVVISLAKAGVQKLYDENPHWVYGYILGTDEVKYSEEKIAQIHSEMFYEDLNKDAIKEGKPIKRHVFNINSDLHLRWLFCERLKMSPKALPGTDSSCVKNIIPSMAADVLREYMLPKWQWVGLLLTYKKLVKLESTYIRPAITLHVDSWLLMDMKQNGTVSGRFACGGGYNLQTLPRVEDELENLKTCEKCQSENVEIIEIIPVLSDLKCKDCDHIKYGIVRPSAIKRGFIAPPGYKIICADYASLEPKVFAFYSEEPALIEVFLKGLDFYSQVYCEIFDKEGKYSADPKAPNFLKKVAKALRTWIKPIGLGIPYGAEEAQVAKMTDSMLEISDKDTGDKILIPNMKEGARIIEEYLRAFPKLKEYMDVQELKAVTFGYVETLLGRRRHLPNAKIIQDILVKYDLDFQDLRSCKWNQLQQRECSPVNKKTGRRVFFSEEALMEMQTALRIDSEVLSENGNWSFIRALLKTDLNNAKNAPIQGTAAHITNKGMLNTTRYFVKLSLDAWVALQIHDEIMCYAKIEHAEKAAMCLQYGMEKNSFGKMINLPMVAKPIICDNLAQAK